jgi:hypothetical protein
MCRMIRGTWHRYSHTTEPRTAQKAANVAAVGQQGLYARKRARGKPPVGCRETLLYGWPGRGWRAPPPTGFSSPGAEQASAVAKGPVGDVSGGRRRPYLHSTLTLLTTAVAVPFAFTVTWNVT